MTNIQIEMLVAAIILLILITFCLTKNRLLVRHSIAWFSLPIVFIIFAIFPQLIETISKWLGFETPSNFIFLAAIALLILICFFLTISISRQQSQITKLIQEISILKKQDKKNDKK